MTVQQFDLLLAGGESDPSIRSLEAAAVRRNASILSLVHGRVAEPVVSFNFPDASLIVGGKICKVHSAFFRYDVFADIAGQQYTPSNRSNDWFAFAAGAAGAMANVRLLNARALGHTGTKLIDLKRAEVIGIPVPLTVVANDYAVLRALADGSDKWIAKPVGGGTYCFPLEDVLKEDLVMRGALPNPAIVQERLDYPEYRVYRIGSKLVVFEIESTHLDYRVDQRAKMTLREETVLSSKIRQNLFRLGNEVNLDFYACDMKFHANRNELCFLELNTSPMFAAHDAVSGGAVSDAILDALLVGNRL